MVAGYARLAAGEAVAADPQQDANGGATHTPRGSSWAVPKLHRYIGRELPQRPRRPRLTPISGRRRSLRTRPCTHELADWPNSGGRCDSM